ncbi:sugar kinase, partial [Kitasatospora sp. NPDC059408]
MTLAVDVGTRFVRLAHVRPDRLPALAELPGAVAGEGVPVPSGQDPARTLAAACAAFRARYGKPSRAVLVAPEAMPPLYRDRIAEAFGRTTPVVELRPATAVLALLRHNGEALEGTWGVCALGTTTIEVSVCVAARRSVGVRRFVRHTPEGGLGAAFDAALLGGAVAGGGPAGDAALAALREARDAPGSAARWERVIARAQQHPARYDDMAVLWVDGREVPAGTARHALAVLREQVGHAAAEAGLDGLPVVAVGGPARLAAVRRAAAGAGRAVGPVS